MSTKKAIFLGLAVVCFSTVITCTNNPASTGSDNAGTITDRDGNVYQTVKIGNQVWMVENFKATKFNDGTPIPNVTDESEWSYLTSPGYCWYENDISNKATYGALYNWYVINTGKLAPAGWHVSTNDDWETLSDFLGVGDAAGGELKEAGTEHWLSPNTGATNSSGFLALPGGFRHYNGGFAGQRSCGRWWSFTECDATNSYYLELSDYYVYLTRICDQKGFGYSVRLVKNN